MILNVLLGLNTAELDAFYVLNTFFFFFSFTEPLEGLGTGNVRVGLFLHSHLPLITPDAWTLSRKAKDNPFTPAGRTWPKTKKHILRCKM